MLGMIYFKLKWIWLVYSHKEKSVAGPNFKIFLCCLNSIYGQDFQAHILNCSECPGWAFEEY